MARDTGSNGRSDDGSPSSVDGSPISSPSLGRAANRRSVLRAAGVTALAAGGFALGGTTVAAAAYDQTLDVVDDLGADPTGEESATQIIQDALQDDTKLAFPGGTYWIDGEFPAGIQKWGSGRSATFDPDDPDQDLARNVALVGEGDVTLKPSDGVEMYILALWGEGVHIENFTLDQTAENTNVGISALVTRDLVIRDVTVEGFADGDGLATIGPGVTEPDGSAVIENVDVTGGSADLSRETGTWVFPDHAGDLLIRGCAYEGMADNAIYASAPGNGGNGSVRVEDCYFRNNNVTAIRLGSTGSYAKNCTVVNDGEIPRQGDTQGLTARAGWVWYQFDGYYENIDVISDHPASHGIVDHSDSTRDLSLDVRNCRFRMNSDDSRAIRFVDPGVESLTLDNVSVTGDAGSGPAVTIDNADVDVQNLCISQSGSNRDGVTLGTVDATITDAVIDVTGEAITYGPGTVLTATNVSEAGHDCVGPDPDHEFGSEPPEWSAVPDDLDGEDFSRTPTPTPSPTASPTATPTPTASPTASPTVTPTDAGTATPTDESTDTGSPGFTSVLTLGALGAASLAALRRATREDE